jgi:hypothetical protein
MGTGNGASFGARLNSNYFLYVNGTRGTVTVQDDDSQDALTGGSGADVYFANLVLDTGDQATHFDLINGLKKSKLALDIDVLLQVPD